MINDFEKGTIEDGGALKIELEPGKYEVYLKIDWCRSNKLKIIIKENEIIKLKCGSPIEGLNYLNPFIMPYYIFFNRDKYLYVKKYD